MDEIWKGAVYQGVDLSWRFEVSTMGRIRNAKNQHIYKLHQGTGGYLQICTSIQGIRKNIHIHRCIAETFISNQLNLEIVNHKDGVKQNNFVLNLEWCDRKENYAHGVRLNLIDPAPTYEIARRSKMGMYKGSHNGMSKLTEDDVLYIRKQYIPKGKGQKCNRTVLAEQFGVSVGLISRIVKGEIWSHVA